ncbi:MAG: T9SS type A sorting domain-containing protein, partial [Candidatus Marinimicrobia bacterium]|nr:T9SS type A sorting domain-containing protein [Candidatus Neomarinimicrobiota bacterium]
MKPYKSIITVIASTLLLLGSVFADSYENSRKAALDAKHVLIAPKGLDETQIKQNIHEPLSVSNGQTRECEFDWSAYGSANCDTAWDDFGIDCATLESTYGWDCAGCDCPGDLPPECGDGSCNGDETELSCPADCTPSAECGACELDWSANGSECCDTAWTEFGIDCATLEGTYGWDCVGCLCPGDVPCEDQGLVTCEFDGSCAATVNDCPAGCEDTGDFIDDCSGDGDCCPLSWIGDGFEDCEDQAYGCDLTCYDNDGGDCAPAVSCEDQGLVTCFDGSCAATEADCPEPGDCAEDCPAGTYWDGFSCYDCSYCLETSDDSACDAPNDCCGMCGGSADPNACGDIASCEDEGLVTCWDNSCAASEADCPDMGDQLVDCNGNVWDNSNTQYAGDGDSDGDGCMDTVYDCVIDNGTCDDIAGECLDASGACAGATLGYTCPDGMIGAWTNDTLCDDGDFGLFANCEELCFDDGACGTMPDDGCTIGDGSNCATAGTGDVNADGAANVLDIVQIVNYILGSIGFDDCQLESADLNGDGAANVLDIVAIVNVILDGRNVDATKAGLIKAGDALNLNADGYIGGVQMTLSHGADFSIELTDKAMVADYRTNGNETTLIIVAPESDELFIADGEYDIVNMIVANSAGQMDVSVVPSSFILSDAYPNPFNPSTSINLSIPEAGHVSVMVYNVMGQLVSTLADGHMNASDYSFTWDASSVPSGVYLITATTVNHASTQKVM